MSSSFMSASLLSLVCHGSLCITSPSYEARGGAYWGVPPRGLHKIASQASGGLGWRAWLGTPQNLGLPFLWSCCSGSGAGAGGAAPYGRPPLPGTRTSGNPSNRGTTAAASGEGASPPSDRGRGSSTG